MSMNWVRDSKAEVIGGEAKAAAKAGQTVFVAVLNEPKTRVGWSGQMKDWSAAIGAIEAEGWTLDQWTVGPDPKGQPQAYPAFRRRT